MNQLSTNQHQQLPSTVNISSKIKLQTHKKKQKNLIQSIPHLQELQLAKNKLRESLWNGRIQIEPPNRYSVSASQKPITSKRSMTLKNIKKIEYPQTQRNIRKGTKTQSQQDESKSSLYPESTKHFNIRKISKIQQKLSIPNQPNLQQQHQQKHNQQPKQQQKQLSTQQNKEEKKEQRKQQKKEEKKQEKKQEKKEETKNEQKLIKEQQQKVEETKPLTIPEQLIAQLQKLSQSHEFPTCHKNLLIFLISNSTHKNLQLLISSEFKKIKAKQSTCSNIKNLINLRQENIKNIESSQIPIPQPIIKQYQISTLKVMQQILKWRNNWEQKIHKFHNSNQNIVFYQNGKNYLLEIWKSLKIKNEPNLNGNPFLIGYQNYPIHNDFILKFRACEIILLQEKLHFYTNS